MSKLAEIEKCRLEIERLPDTLEWRESVLAQLDFCLEVVAGRVAPDRLEHLTMGLISVREMEGWTDGVPSLLRQIQYDLQQEHLSYAAKVRLGIGGSTNAAFNS